MPWEAQSVTRRHVRPKRSGCSHPRSISVRSAGLERSVCERCGHMSFVFLEESSGNVDREKFARAIDSPEE